MNLRLMWKTIFLRTYFLLYVKGRYTLCHICIITDKIDQTYSSSH